MKKSNKRIKTVFFDLDGTLVDTEPAAARAVEECFKEWGLKVEKKDAQYIIGRTWASAFEFLFCKYKMPVSAKKAAETMSKRYQVFLSQELRAVPGGVEAVRSLAGHYELALVSGSGRAEIFWALDKLGIRGFFKLILGAEDYKRSKPSPDGYLRAIKTMACEPHSGLVFEDSAAGISSARDAGLWVVAVTGTNCFVQDTTLAHDHIADLKPVCPKWVLEFQSRVVSLLG